MIKEQHISRIITFTKDIYPNYRTLKNKFSFNSKISCKDKIILLKKGNNIRLRQFAQEAVDKGALGLICDSSFNASNISREFPLLRITNINRYYNDILDLIYDYPTSKMFKVGVTGTDGKTSTCHFIAEMISKISPQKKIGMITSEGNGIYPKLRKTNYTTPDNYLLYHNYSKFRESNVDILIVECSSQGLHQGRLNSHSFDVSILTNINRDHIEYHGSLKNYLKSKMILFNMTTKSVFVNKKNKNIRFANKKVSKVLFSDSIMVNNKISDNYIPRDLLYKLMSQMFPKKKSIIKNKLKKLKSVNGRHNYILGKKKEKIVIDYAHTPSAMMLVCEKITKSREFQLNKYKLFIVFGCGGDRDKEKRRLMGKIAMKYADHIIVTDDNPRLEDPKSITNQIISVFNTKTSFEEIHNRKLAIKTAIKKANSDCVILIIGKGNESEIIYNKHVKKHNDIEYVNSIVR